MSLTRVLALSLIFFLCSFNGTDCDIEKAKSICITKLDHGFSFLKSYDLDESEEEYSFIFSRGVNYMLTSALSQDPESQVEIRLYDKSKKLIFSNYNKRKKTYSNIIYPCTYTGVHYIKYINKDNNKSKCGAGVLGYKRR
jgi:hypothetical protein